VRLQQDHFSSAYSARNWRIIACILLVGIAVAAQTLHSHPDGIVSDSKHCSACHLAHSPANLGPVVELAYVPVGATSLYSIVTLHPGSFLASFALFSRPPPVV